MNLADALERQYYQEGDCIIKQVRVITTICIILLLLVTFVAIFYAKS